MTTETLVRNNFSFNYTLKSIFINLTNCNELHKCIKQGTSESLAKFFNKFPMNVCFKENM